MKKIEKKLDILKVTSPVSLVRQIKTNKKAFVAYLILMALVVLVMGYSIFVGQWESFFVCILTMILFLIPPFVERTFKVELPTTLEVIALLFAFCAEILGEIGGFYMKFPIWDTILHSVNGLMFAAFGFCMVDVLNRNKKFLFELSPMYVALFSFCFSMTIGVLWEFFEFGVDIITGSDMQKDRMVQNIHSVFFDSTKSNTVLNYNEITSTTVHMANGDVLFAGGYLDIGLIDTMKDLMINFVGAVLFSIIGYFYIKHRGKGKFAHHFIPVFLEQENTACEDLSLPNPLLEKQQENVACAPTSIQENNAEDVGSTT